MPVKRARRERMAKALELHEQGATYRMIGEALHISHAQAHRDVTDALKEITLPMAEEVRKLHQARYESLYLLAWATAKGNKAEGRPVDMRAAEVALRTLAQQGRMYGVDEASTADGATAVRSLLEKLMED